MDNYLSFLDAAKILKEVKAKKVKNLKLLTSVNTKQLELYLQAYARTEFIDLKIETIPFGTLRQHIINDIDSNTDSLLLLTPADFSPKLDWRTGFSEKTIPIEEIRNEIKEFGCLVAKYKFESLFLLPTSLPQLFQKSQDLLSVELLIRNIANDLGAFILKDIYFSLDSYLISGCPVAGKDLSLMANDITKNIFQDKVEKRRL